MRRLIPGSLVTAGVFIWVIILAATPQLPVVLSSRFPRTLTLERAFPVNQRVEVGRLRARDQVRHGRLLQSVNGVIDFAISGTYDPYVVGLYYTKVQLGNPAQDFYVQIDTGSDVLWVSCSGCNGCPTTTGLQEMNLNFFDASTSNTASTVSCSDKKCGMGSQSSDTMCSSQKNQCSYQFQYGDGSGTSGYYVYDLLHLDTVVNGNIQNASNTAPIVFGCSTSQTGALTKSDRAVDGIFGFGQQPMSVISQLASQGVAPRAFSHCLRGDTTGGGILVFGEIVEPGMVYTPLVSGQPHYNLNLQSISVNRQTLSIDSSVFATSSSSGTIIDSGTTLAYFAEDAYTPFLNAINSAVSQSVRPLLSKGNQCYLITSSVDQVFPQVSLNFQGGAAMVLRPEDYLLEQNSIGGAAVWCMGIQRISGQQLTILGDLVLKDKAVVYDIAGQRVGWVNYDCSTTVNVSVNMNSGRDTNTYINTGQISGSSSIRKTTTSCYTAFVATTVLLVLLLQVYTPACAYLL